MFKSKSYEINYLFVFIILLFFYIEFNCPNILIAHASNDKVEEHNYNLNCNTIDCNTISLYEYNDATYITIDDLCPMTRSSFVYGNNTISVKHGILSTIFDYNNQEFSDGRQTVETKILNTGTYYLIPALEFLTYYGANVKIDKISNTFYCYMPECTAWEAMDIDYDNTLIDIYKLYGGKEKLTFSLTLDIIMDFMFNGTPSIDGYMVDAYNKSLSINLYDFDVIKEYQKERDVSLYEFLISDEGQEAIDFATTILDNSISGVEYLSEYYYNVSSLKYSDLVKSNYHAGLLDNSTYYAEQILNDYRRNKSISDFANDIKTPLTSVAPVFVQTALESAQQLKYTAATNNLVYRVMGDENVNYLGMYVGDNNWFRIANTYKNAATIVSHNYLDNAKNMFSDIIGEQLIEDCIKSSTDTSPFLFTFSKECAVMFIKSYPQTKSSLQAFESDRAAMFLSELQENVYDVITNIDLYSDYNNLEVYQKYIEASTLYCRVSIALYDNLITMVNKFTFNKNQREYWISLFQEYIDKLAVSLYKLTIFQDDSINACIPLDLIKFRTENYIDDKFSVFKNLPKIFYFCSGAGGWETFFNLEIDGTFTGQYSNSNMGDTGDEYPNGTIEICKFNGEFASPEKINEYIYYVKLNYINIDETNESEYYEDGIRYINTIPYGFDNGKNFLLYLPGCNFDYMDENFSSWCSLYYNINYKLPLNYYGLYNIGGEHSFLGWK